ncbi:hypothetical protein MATL_G00124000 [Megalops atlanticus]|uniref:OCA domain-containing protein n=1 Tax=Megalops atlanticus TaxID=7932 RepID=A0A9D3PY81_MEGAT|nr:hypothetical protein MATL_G00124000 [Megalops atlanticus]
METEYSKRVYQGVRVKHTVKDLLAEKRSRQTNMPRYSGGTSPSQPAFVQMPGSHVLPGYYGMRRPFIPDPDLCHPSKQFPAEVYPPSLGGKPLSCDPSSVTGYSSLIDSYYPESFGDYRSAAFSSGGSSLFPSSALSSLLPPFPGDSHFLLRDTWDQPGTDSVGQGEALCSDGLAPVTSAESGSPSPYRASSRPPALSSQSYSLHSLDEVHYSNPYPTPSSYACPPYMTAPHDLPSKLPSLSIEDSDSTSAPLTDTSSWPKDEGSAPWSAYEIRRSY